MASIREYATFFREFRQRFETTGAIAPSSRFLARAMTRYLRQRPDDSAPVRVLEIGPGTGAVTRTIVTLLRPGDRFDLVELNDAFAAHLQQRFQTEPAWRKVAEQSHVHCLPLQDFQADAPYDFVISGLPLNNFPAELAEDITRHYLRHLAPGGVLSWFEYQFVRSIRTRIGARSERARLSAIEATLGGLCRKHRIRRDWVFINLPPAWVQHLRVASTEPANE